MKKVDNMGVELMCGCEITDEGQFIVSSDCRYCKECNTVSRIHPFGNERLE